MSGPTPKDIHEQARIARRLAEVGFVLPGTLFERYTRCGKTNCRCHGDPPDLHGPYYQWTRSIPGRRAPIVRRLPAELAERYWPWFDNAALLRATVTELQALSIDIVERDRGSQP